MRDPCVLISCGFGLGFIKPAPGTWGTLLGLALWWWGLSHLALLAQLFVIALVFTFGCWAITRVEQRYQVSDASAVVIDEMVGVWIALLFAPRTLWLVACGFLVFRVFDIVKPGLIGWADNEVKGGFGVMLDDAIAGILCCFVLQLSLWLLAQAP